MENSALNVNYLLSKLFKAADFEVDVRTKARSQNGGVLKLTFLLLINILLINFDRNERDMIEIWKNTGLLFVE